MHTHFPNWKWILILAVVSVVLILGWKRFKDSQVPATNETADKLEG